MASGPLDDDLPADGPGLVRSSDIYRTALPWPLASEGLRRVYEDGSVRTWARHRQDVPWMEQVEGDPTREWPIPLPQEHTELLDRVLEARNSTGDVEARWRYNGGSWTVIEGPSTTPWWAARGIGVGDFADLFEEIVAGCIRYEWTLWSCPAPPRIPQAQPCGSVHDCGNTAVTTRRVGERDVGMCESCAAERDEKDR
jgi:hypothetical protein